MKNLSFTQEYFLLAVNGKGELPFLSSSEIACCLVAGGIMELTRNGYVIQDENKKLTLIKSWDNSLPYLTPIYNVIESFKEAKKVEAVVEPFALAVKDKQLKELVSTFRTSLIAEDCIIEESEEGLLKDKTRYIPKPELVTQIIEKVRAEFLEEGSIAEDVLCLSVLLVQSNLIKNYFSKVEVMKMKERIKEVRNSDAYVSVKAIFDYMDAVAALIIIISAN